MRELKFRAWDKINKAYTYVTLGDLICGACTETGDKKLSGNEQIWEQYTGLHDENGKEIYEGSLIKEVVYGRKSVIWEVRYSQDDCCFELHRIRGAYFGDSLLGGDGSQYEIIGDIHRNLELLEEAK